MNIPSEFDVAIQEERKRVNANFMRTAEKLAGRIENFLKDVDGSHRITKGQKTAIRKELFRHLHNSD